MTTCFSITRHSITTKILSLLEHAVALLLEALRYTPEGRGFDS
jgi:hypothetical protein